MKNGSLTCCTLKLENMIEVKAEEIGLGLGKTSLSRENCDFDTICPVLFEKSSSWQIPFSTFLHCKFPSNIQIHT